ncbi:MAG: ABC transporter substrate-binding protein [Dehalococcoidia bacterium]|nr:ABC transporter substrate-binding protein [Dehalococcoidia bacterium]
MKITRLLFLLSTIVTLVFAFACGDDDEQRASEGKPTAGQLTKKDFENPRYGGTYRTMTHYGTTSLDPATTSTGGSAILHAWVYEKLYHLEGNDNDSGSTLKPLLAQSTTASADLKTFTIKLKQGIRWQNLSPTNGREFEARDVVFTFQEYMKPTSVLYSQFSQIESVEAADKYTVTVRLKEPNAHLIESIQNRQEYIFPYDLPDRSNRAIGTGPFMVTSFTPGQNGTMKAVRNPDYWQKDPKGRQLPYIDEFEMVTNTDAGAHLAALRTGQVNSVGLLTPPSRELLLKSNPDMQVYDTVATTYASYSIGFKSEDAPWSDQRVRCAVSKAIDKKRLSQLMNGEDGIVVGPIPFSWIEDRPLTEEDLGPCYKFDLAGAKKLLAEAGFSASKPLELSWFYGDMGDLTNSESVALQQMLGDAGIKFNLDRVDYTTYSTAIYRRGWKDSGAAFSATACTAGVARAACIFDKFNGRFNFGLYGTARPADIDAKLSELKVTTDPEKLRLLFRYFWDTFVNQVPEAIIRAPFGKAVTTSNVRNVIVRQGITTPLSACNTCRFIWFSDAPRTTASAAEEQGGSDRTSATVQLQAVAERARARVVRR